MDAVNRRWATLVSTVALALGGSMVWGTSRAQESPTPPQPESAAPAETANDPAQIVAEAEAALSQAEFRKVDSLVNQALALLSPGPTQAPMDDEHRRLLARTLDLLAQAQYNLGQKNQVGSTIERLLQVEPGYKVDAATAGPRFVEQVESRRKKMTGILIPACGPLACDRLVVDGRAYAVTPESRVPVLAGAHQVVLGRRNFRDTAPGELTIGVGAEVVAKVALEPVARDLQITTLPAGAKVFVHGKEVGVTEPGSAPDGPSRPLVIPSLPPGPLAVVVQAPCFRRLEQAVEIVLDAQDPAPIDLGVLQLQKARSVLELTWDGLGGELVLDGKPVQPGRLETCPGGHELAFSVSGKRVWFETIDLKDDEVRALSPKPRPTVALVKADVTGLPGFPNKGWNEVPVAPAVAAALAGTVTESLGTGPLPLYPAVRRLKVAGLAEKARAAAPEADLVALVLPGNDPVRPSKMLALVDPRRAMVELTGWPEREPKTAGVLAEELLRLPRWFRPFFGFDWVERQGRSPVVIDVVPEGPAAQAGLAAGQELTALNGKPIGPENDPDTVAAALAPGQALQLTVKIGGVDKPIAVTAVPALEAPNPAGLRRQAGFLLLPALARAAVARVAGPAEERIAGGVMEGLILAALGLDEDAAGALERVAVDPKLDPARDAFGTVNVVLARLMERIGRGDYAQEVRTRVKGLTQARFGGRTGPRLAPVSESSED